MAFVGIFGVLGSKTERTIGSASFLTATPGMSVPGHQEIDVLILRCWLRRFLGTLITNSNAAMRTCPQRRKTWFYNYLAV